MTNGLNENALQKGIYTALSTDAALISLLPAGAAGVTSFAVPNLALPYVLLAGTGCRLAGTQGYGGAEGEAVLDIYSRRPGGGEARTIAAAAAAAIADGLSLEGHRVLLCHVTDSATRLQSDGETYLARIVARVVTEPVEDTP